MHLSLAPYSHPLANGGGMRDHVAGQYGHFDQLLTNNYMPNQIAPIYPNIQQQNLLNQIQQNILNNQLFSLMPQATSLLNPNQVINQTNASATTSKPSIPIRPMLTATKIKRNSAALTPDKTTQEEQQQKLKKTSHDDPKPSQKTTAATSESPSTETTTNHNKLTVNSTPPQRAAEQTQTSNPQRQLILIQNTKIHLQLHNTLETFNQKQESQTYTSTTETNWS